MIHSADQVEEFNSFTDQTVKIEIFYETDVWNLKKNKIERW